eukprot:gene3343-4200_t
MRATSPAGHSGTLRALLEDPRVNTDHGVEAKDEEGRTPFLQAAVNGKLNACQVLYMAGVRVEASDDSGNTALALAAKGGHVDVVCWLLSMNADASAINKRGESVLWGAVVGEHFDADGVAELLVQRWPFHGELGVPMIEVRNEKHITLLGWAAANGRTSTAVWLVEHGADLLAPQGEHVPRQVADYAGHWETAEVLGQLARAEFALCSK